MSEVDISAVPLIARHRAIHSEMVAINYESREVTYVEFHQIVGRLAAALRADGVGPGDRVAYAGLNSLTFLVTYFAATWVGAAFVPLNFRLAPREVRAVLEDARPDVLVAEPVQATAIDDFVTELTIRHALVVDDDPALEPAADLSARWQSFLAFRTAHEEIPPHVRQSDDDLAALLYTSGSTGKAKGVMLTHGNLWWNWVNVDSVVDTRFGDVSLAVAPLFHIGGFNALALRTITRGGTLVVRRSFVPAQALQDLVNFRVNSMFLVPAMLAGIQREPGFDDADLSNLRSTIAAGAPVPPALIATYAEKGVLLQQAWGLTETAPFATYLESSMTSEKLGSCGVAMPYTEVKVVDPTTMGDVAVAGRTGEFWVRGPNVSRGYWNNPEATAAVFTPDGWFRTGDIGYADEDGYLFIVDRLKDMIITGGENVYPAEIENVLAAHPEVEDVAVIGVPDPQWGETVCAVVSFRDEALSLDDIRDFLTKSVARYKLPRRLVELDVVPRNGAGKLDKPAIRLLVSELDGATSSTVDTAPFTEAVRVPSKKR
ncbi:MAG: AMP-binding protein [Microbacterium ginsengisoli]|uniref:AMP-binding protein n=2 Tax=Microbacteriaceae TaxID=85023 RepID=UPI0007017299|nr:MULTISPECIES: AMP-binding protein [Microbacterium]KQR91157.1 fatty-acid--CoA ligase [Microbacterium sp. Leaf347]MBN9197182.1 AMP-binding protein [Microbacterium ginsengisoli]MBN9208632.1 AMP-binding protein [Microbacterium ginsengisoli]